MGTLWQDLRYSLRTLRKNPGFAAVVILILALGVGANTAIFSLVNAVLLRQLPFPEADRLVMVWEDMTFLGFSRNTPAPANFVDWRKQNQVFEDMAAIRFRTLNLTGDGEPERLDARGVTASFFSIVRVQPLLGRPILDDDDRPEAGKVAVISYGLWQRRFGGEANIVGKDIVLDGEKYSVIGVMPPRFSFPTQGIDVYVPTGFDAATWNRRTSHFLFVAARLKPGISWQRAQSDMQTIAERLQRDYPDTNARVGATVLPMREQYAGGVRLAFIVLLGAVGFVLLIACANIANLLLARAASRRKEMAVRAALGAGRWRVIRQLLTENILLAGIGGALGVLLARASFTFLSRLIPPAMGDGSPLQLDYQVLAFSLLVSLAAGVLFGLAPAWQASRVDLNDALKQGGRQSFLASGKRVRSSLVVAEVALAVVLLTGAGLLMQTLARLRGVDLGFRTDNSLVMTTVLSTAKYTKDTDRVAFARQVLDRIKALPGVVNAGYVSTLPLIIKGNTRGFVVEGHPLPLPGESLDANYREVSSEYLQTMGIPLRRGRFLEEQDRAESKAVAVINETMARKFWPNEDALSKRFKFTNDPTQTWREIVGIAGDIHQMGLEEPPRAELYMTLQQARMPDPNFLVVRTTGNPLNLAAAVRNEIRAVNPEQPISNIRTLEDIVEVEVSQRHLQMELLGGFSALALLLATIGIYGVLHYTVAQRTPEIGVRMALGARRQDVLRMVVLQGIRLATIGVIAGLAAALALTRVMSSLLFGVSASDPATYAAVTAVLLVVAAVASYIPARRASRVDPMVALHYE